MVSLLKQTHTANLTMNTLTNEVFFWNNKAGIKTIIKQQSEFKQTV